MPSALSMTPDPEVLSKAAMVVLRSGPWGDSSPGILNRASEDDAKAFALGRQGETLIQGYHVEGARIVPGADKGRGKLQ